MGFPNPVDQGVAQTTPGVSATNTVTSGSFTPPAGALLVAVAYIDRQIDTPDTFTLSDTFTGTGTWSEGVTLAHTPAPGGYSSRVSIWTATAGAAPGSGTITVTRTAGTSDQWLWANFLTVTGQAASPIGATGSHGQITGTTNTVVLSAIPRSDSLVLGAENMGGVTGAAVIVPPTNWSEIHDDVAPASWGDEVESAYINGGSAQTLVWTGLTGTDVEDAVALEILAAPSGSPPAAPYFGPFSWLWQSPHGTDPVIVTALDVVPASPLPLVEWLRRRHDYETEQQQPRHLLDVSVTQSVDSPNPQPLPVVEWLRRRPDYEADQQPRRLVDVSETQGVPLPTPLPTIVWLRRRHDYETEQQPRRLLDTTVTQSVDSPTGAPVIQIEFLPRFIGQQARGLPVDVLAPAVTPDNPTGNVTQTYIFRPYPWEPWLQGRHVDTTVTQSVDSPPGIAPQPSPVPRARWQGQQAVPLAIDLLAPVTGPFGAVQQVAGYQRVTTWQQWIQRSPLDLSVTQSVDSPPGFFRPALPTVTRSGIQYEQAANRYLDQPATPTGQQPLEVYARQAAAFQAWQKSPQFLFPSVDAPPLSGPYPTAPYRRPVPPTPYRLPQLIPLPPTFFPDTNPDIIFGREPGVILGAEPAAVYGREPGVVVGAEPEPIYGRERR